MVSVLNVLGVYRFYESVLSNNIKKGKVPKHIAIILDGNRRWASNKSTQRILGHIAGADTAERLLEWCHEIGITTITLFLLSTENLERSSDELNELFELFYERLSKLLTDERIARFNIRVKALGRLELLTPESELSCRIWRRKPRTTRRHF